MIRTYTPADLATLTLPALPGLLDGFCGPICDGQYELFANNGNKPSQNGYLTLPAVHTRGLEYSAPLHHWHVPLSRPEARYRVACWLAMGERCFTVQPEGHVCTNGWRNQPAGLGCPSCHGTGYLRAPAPLWWALSPGPSTLSEWMATACLHASALRVGARIESIRDVLASWCVAGARSFGQRRGLRTPTTLDVGDCCWCLRPGDSDRYGVGGDGSGDPGRAAADAAALSAGYALLDGDTLRAEVPDE